MSLYALSALPRNDPDNRRQKIMSNQQSFVVIMAGYQDIVAAERGFKSIAQLVWDGRSNRTASSSRGMREMAGR